MSERKRPASKALSELQRLPFLTHWRDARIRLHREPGHERFGQSGTYTRRLGTLPAYLDS